MRVVIGMADLHIGDPMLHQSAGQQTLLSQVVIAIFFQQFARFLGNIEQVAFLHQLLGLLETLQVRIRFCCSATL